MSTVICREEFDLDIDYKHETVTIQAGVEFCDPPAPGQFHRVVVAERYDAVTVRFEALPALVAELQRLIDAEANRD